MQPRSSQATVGRASGADGRRPTSAPRRRPVPTPADLSALLTDLSATVCQLRVLEQHYLVDADLEDRLRGTATEVEALISQLLRTDGGGPSTPPAPRDPVDTPRQQALEQAFLAWLAQPTSAEELAPPDGARQPLAEVLGELSLSRRELPAETAAGLGLPDGTTVGHTAAELLLAVKDPAGPRCRSFRAAVYYLRGLERVRYIDLEVGAVCR